MSEQIENQEPQQTVQQLSALLDTERQARATAEAELAKRDTALSEAATASDETRKNLTDAVAAYKLLVIKANPTIPEELIIGDSVRAINNTLEAAKIVVGKVRTNLEADIASRRVPAGAPPRSTPDVENLTPREKIQYGVTKGK